MKKTYTIRELSTILDTKEHNVYNWIRYAIPENLKPKKGWNNDVNRETYIFDENDLDILIEIKDLKNDGFNYKEIKKMMPELIYNVQEEAAAKHINKPSESLGLYDSFNFVELKKNRSLEISLIALSISVIILIINMAIFYKVF